MILADMAKMLGVSVPYLSAVELGKKNVPSGFVDKISDLLVLDVSARANESLHWSFFPPRERLFSRTLFNIPGTK